MKQASKPLNEVVFEGKTHANRALKDDGHGHREKMPPRNESRESTIKSSRSNHMYYYFFNLFFGSHLSQRHPLRIVLGPEGNDGG